MFKELILNDVIPELQLLSFHCNQVLHKRVPFLMNSIVDFKEHFPQGNNDRPVSGITVLCLNFPIHYYQTDRKEIILL